MLPHWDIISLSIFSLLPLFLPFCTFTELGFCEASITSDVDRGEYVWEETKVDSSTQTPCDFGPSNEQATRECERRNSWGEPQILMCGTQVSHLYSEFNESVVSDHRTRPWNKLVSCYPFICHPCMLSRGITVYSH